MSTDYYFTDSMGAFAYQFTISATRCIKYPLRAPLLQINGGLAGWMDGGFVSRAMQDNVCRYNEMRYEKYVGKTLFV